MGELLRVVVLGNEYWLEYQNDSTNWSMKTRKLSLDEAMRYEDLMEDLQEQETNILQTFIN